MEYCTGLQVEGVQVEDMIDLFIAVQWHRVMDQNSEAKEVLAKFQADLLCCRKQQINPVVDYYREVGFEESEGDSHSEGDSKEEDEDIRDEWDPVSDMEGNGEERNHSEYQSHCVLSNPHNHKVQNLKRKYRPSWLFLLNQSQQGCGLEHFVTHLKCGLVYLNTGQHH